MRQAQENLNSIATQAEQEHNNVSNQLSDVEKDLERQRTLTPESARLRDQISQKRADIGGMNLKSTVIMSIELGGKDGQLRANRLKRH